MTENDWNMGTTTNTISLLGECISTTLPSPDRLVQQIMTPRGVSRQGTTRQGMEDGHIKFYSVKQMAVTFIPHIIHVDGIFTYIWLIYMVDLWMLWVLFYQIKQLYMYIYTKKNKTKKNTWNLTRGDKEDATGADRCVPFCSRCWISVLKDRQCA